MILHNAREGECTLMEHGVDSGAEQQRLAVEHHKRHRPEQDVGQRQRQVDACHAAAGVARQASFQRVEHVNPPGPDWQCP